MKKRKGRGNSSKTGNYCGRGLKGQKSRSGYSRKKLFEGGQTNFIIKLPKVGFNKNKKKNKNRICYINNFNIKKEFLNYFKKIKNNIFNNKIKKQHMILGSK